METAIRRWGNSLAVRIPKVLAEEVGLYEDSPVELSLKEGRLIVAPIVEPRYELETLLEQVTPQNLHREIDTGEVVGVEGW